MPDSKPSVPIQAADSEPFEQIQAAFSWHVYVILVVRVGNKKYILMLRHPLGNDLGLPGGTMVESVADMAPQPDSAIRAAVIRNLTRECWEELGNALMSPRDGKPLLCVEDLQPLAPHIVSHVYQKDGEAFRCHNFYFCIDVTERLAARTHVRAGTPGGAVLSMERAKTMASDPVRSPSTKKRAKEFAGLEFVEYSAVADGTTSARVWEQQLPVLQSDDVHALVRACVPAAPPLAACQSRLSNSGSSGSDGSDDGRGAGDDGSGDGWKVPSKPRRKRRNASDRMSNFWGWPNSCDRNAYLRSATPCAHSQCFQQLVTATAAATAAVAAAAASTAAAAAALVAPRAPRQAALCRHFSSTGFCNRGTACHFRHKASVHGGRFHVPAQGGGSVESSVRHTERAW
mmetsp:Transcript_22236/g.66318  ORF Transcript_22236/g.66318 Transcript_22236/m.66318 type:complete len:401 (-) Transcript_22236:490-1692(-)